MRLRSTLLLPAVLLALLGLVALRPATADDETPVETTEAPRVLRPAEAGVGGYVPNVEVLRRDTAGEPAKVELHTLLGDGPALLVARSAACPLCRKYGPVLARLSAELADRGVRSVFLNVTRHDDTDAIELDRTRYGWDAPYVQDAELAATLGLRTTTEVLLLDASRTVVYRGAVDDRYGLGYVRDEPRHTYLLDAVEALLRGERPPVEATTAPGCRLAHDAVESPAREATYHREVARLLERRCVTCHRDEGPAPFPLDTYEEVAANAPMIDFVVRRRTMPPWFATGESVHMSNDLSLTDDERSLLLGWIEDDCPEGDPTEHPQTYAPRGRWRLGEPDVVLSPRQTFEIPAEGVVPYRYAVVPTSSAEDRWVTGFEIQNDHPQVLHHVLVFLRYPRRHPEAHEQRDFRGGLEGFFAAMVPGQASWTWPEGVAKRLPSDAALVFQIHYTPTGEAVRDEVRLGLHLADAPPERRVVSQGIYDVRFRIPPGAERHPVHASYRFRRAGVVTGFMPHMHLRGTAFRYELELPGEERRVVLDIPRYDFNWQLAYRPAEPLRVPAGAVMHATGWYDNSADNPANPDPTSEVRFGEQTYEEMMIGYLDWIPDPE